MRSAFLGWLSEATSQQQAALGAKLYPKLNEALGPHSKLISDLLRAEAVRRGAPKGVVKEITPDLVADILSDWAKQASTYDPNNPTTTGMPTTDPSMFRATFKDPKTGNTLYFYPDGKRPTINLDGSITLTGTPTATNYVLGTGSPATSRAVIDWNGHIRSVESLPPSSKNFGFDP